MALQKSVSPPFLGTTTGDIALTTGGVSDILLKSVCQTRAYLKTSLLGSVN